MNKLKWSRQALVGQIGIIGQEKLAVSAVLVVGCGATGTHVAEMLVRAGIGKVTLIDDDVVVLSNLQRQGLFDEADIGRLKVEVAQEKLSAINEDCQLMVRAVRFDRWLLTDTETPDVVLDCTDNFLAREQINDYCLSEKLPWVFAACAGVTGQVMAVNPTIGPCLSCVFPNLTELEENCETLGAITPLVSLVSSLQMSLVLKILVGDSVNFGQLIAVDAWQLTMDKFAVTKQKDCPRCGKGDRVADGFKKVCGGAYQATLSVISADKLYQFCAAQGYQLKESRLASAVSFEENALTSAPDSEPQAPVAKNKQKSRELTIFRNGRVLAYGFDHAPNELLTFISAEKTNQIPK